MRGSRILAAEFLLAVGFVSWAAIKHGYWPWPPTLVKLGIGFAVLGVVAQADENIAATLGGGFLLAGFLRQYQKGIKDYQGGVVPIGANGASFYPLKIGDPLPKKGT